MKHTLFVYYKVPQAEHASAKMLVDKALAQIQHRFTSLQINLMRRPEVSSEGFETWMEVYHHPSGVSAEMKAHIASVFTDAGLQYKRAIEDFIDLKD
jgi:hypothetical protein